MKELADGVVVIIIIIIIIIIAVIIIIVLIIRAKSCYIYSPTSLFLSSFHPLSLHDTPALP
jgi:hypothetical protein